ncbi:hypothetical protein EG327_005353 [Venturia inaequalis]|uniref:Uncharacterized protein n=1 Tax=Venturia inaequalis TaxID=5025 RepID=A0A8H3VTN9_VENIN|nr:hypothetical protein EG327_005353 [Venturia inaequalis]
MAAQWPADVAMHVKRWGGVNCWRNNWGRLECRRNDDDNQSFFKSTGIWILIAFLIAGIVIAIVALVCCLFLRRRKSRSRSPSRSVSQRDRDPISNGDTWYRRGPTGGGGGRDDGYTGYRRGDVDQGPPPEGYYARGETAYPKGGNRARSRSLERRRSLEEKRG